MVLPFLKKLFDRGMPVTAKQCYAELKSATADSLLSSGFKRTRGGMLGYSKPLDNGEHLTVWFQCDKWGWDKRWGSQFTVEFQRSNDPAPGTGSLLSRKRIGDLLEGHPEIEEIRSINDAIIRSLPGHRAREAKFVPSPIDGKPVQIVGYGPSDAPYEPGHDIWLNYYADTDVEVWGRYFNSHLARFIHVYERGLLSPLQEARARYDIAFEAARSKIVDGRDPRAAVTLLREYIRGESNDYFRGAAQRSISMICEKYPDAAN